MADLRLEYFNWITDFRNAAKRGGREKRERERREGGKVREEGEEGKVRQIERKTAR